MLLTATPGLAHADELPSESAPVVEDTAPVTEDLAPADEAPAPVADDVAPVEYPAPAVEVPAPVETTPETPATPTPATKVLKWTLPNGGTPDNVTWPQPVFDASTIPCGTSVWLQVDTYPYATADDHARTDALAADGVLTYGEDHGWAQSWTFEKFTAPACIPVVPPTPTADVTAICGYATVTLTNPQKPGTIGQTAAFVVNVDGEYYGAYAVPADGSVVIDLGFNEDTGDHLVKVYQAGVSEWALIGNATVSSDCIVPEEPTTPSEPEESVTPEEPVAPAQTAVTAASTARTTQPTILAETGGEFSPVLPITGALLLAAAGVVWFARRATRP
ncbi:LPXTG cell wall anchor domain-containing protein [Microbacterium maritypicum]